MKAFNKIILAMIMAAIGFNYISAMQCPPGKLYIEDTNNTLYGSCQSHCGSDSNGNVIGIGAYKMCDDGEELDSNGSCCPTGVLVGCRKPVYTISSSMSICSLGCSQGENIDKIGQCCTTLEQGGNGVDENGMCIPPFAPAPQPAPAPAPEPAPAPQPAPAPLTCTGKFIAADGLSCVTTCPKYYSGNKCVNTCSQFIAGKQCVIACPAVNMFTPLSGNICVSSCPPGQQPNTKRQCLPAPAPAPLTCTGKFIAADGLSCVTTCPKYYSGNKCVNTCPQFIAGKQCVIACPAVNMFTPLSGNVCVASCPPGQRSNTKRQCLLLPSPAPVLMATIKNDTPFTLIVASGNEKKEIRPEASLQVDASKVTAIQDKNSQISVPVSQVLTMQGGKTYTINDQDYKLVKTAPARDKIRIENTLSFPITVIAKDAKGAMSKYIAAAAKGKTPGFVVLGGVTVTNIRLSSGQDLIPPVAYKTGIYKITLDKLNLK